MGERQFCLKFRTALFSFIFKLTQVFNNATATARFAGDTGVTTMQNEPMMHVTLNSAGTTLSSFSSTFSTVLPIANLVRLLTR